MLHMGKNLTIPFYNNTVIITPANGTWIIILKKIVKFLILSSSH